MKRKLYETADFDLANAMRGHLETLLGSFNPSVERVGNSFQLQFDTGDDKREYGFSFEKAADACISFAAGYEAIANKPLFVVVAPCDYTTASIVGVCLTRQGAEIVKKLYIQNERDESGRHGNEGYTGICETYIEK